MVRKMIYQIDCIRSLALRLSTNEHGIGLINMINVNIIIIIKKYINNNNNNNVS